MPFKKVKLRRDAAVKRTPSPGPLAEKNRQERAIKADILLALGQRDDVMVLPVNAGVYLAPDGSGRRVRSAPTGTADILCVQRRVCVEQRIINGGGYQPLTRLDPLTYGQAIAIEVKQKTGRQRDAQAAWEAAWTRRGGIYVIARSVDEALAAFQYN